MEIAMASKIATRPTNSQFHQLGIPKFSVGSSIGFVTIIPATNTFNFQTAKCFLFTSSQRRDVGLRNFICEAGPGLETSVADSGDAISVKKAEIVVETQDNDKMQVRVDLTGNETQRVFDLVLTNLAKTAPPIPGFRRQKGGKTTQVPKTFLLGILGEERVTKFVIEEIVTSTMAQYVKKEDLKVKDNKINTTQSAEELKSSFKPGSDFGFNAIIELQNSEVETPS
ncbi:uncharacterized protein LOC21401111 isoform X2 [Morus notabilis]|uniref:uncharacterized protein LOC21401111 isoform X2 n=1 Tax=Morus notabilis TaxID=981085 RepID=UPI000CED142A|nr:uncharacterized protein LOC21401111 isoform X2 [Morus notabilis]